MMVQIGDITVQDQADLTPNPFVSSFSRDATLASGTQGITGVGFKPSSVVFLMTENGNNTGMSIGVDNLTAKRCVADHHGEVANANNSLSEGILMIQAVGISYRGHITSFDTDGFTITWERVGATTNLLICSYMAFK